MSGKWVKLIDAAYSSLPKSSKRKMKKLFYSVIFDIWIKWPITKIKIMRNSKVCFDILILKQIMSLLK